jgi:hypothetical protein
MNTFSPPYGVQENVFTPTPVKTSYLSQIVLGQGIEPGCIAGCEDEADHE